MIKLTFKVARVLNHTMKRYGGIGGIEPCILNLDTRWKLMLSFTLQPLYSTGEKLPVPIRTKLYEKNNIVTSTTAEAPRL
jgi:hypothetical protein